MIKKFLVIFTSLCTLGMSAAMAQSSNMIEDESFVKSFELFNTLITSEATGIEKKRQTEFAIRLLTTFKGSLGYNIALAIATNSNECADSRKLAFDIGKELAPEWFFNEILKSMNIVLAKRNNKYDDKAAGQVKKYLKSNDSGYPGLVESIFVLLSGNRIRGNPPSLEEINGINLKMHRRDYSEPIVDFDQIHQEKLKKAILTSWNDGNGSNRKANFKDLLMRNKATIRGPCVTTYASK